MSSRTEEVRLKTVWDTADAEKGGKRIEKIMGNIEKASDRLNKKHGGKAGGGDFAMGLRDLAEGRGINALQRFGHTIGATAGRLAAYMIALKAAGAATSWFREQVEKTDSAHERLQATFEKSNRGDRFSSSAEGSASLSARIREKDAQLKEETEQQSNLQFMGDSQKSMMEKRFGPGNMRWGRGLAQMYQGGRDFLGLPTFEQQQHSSEQRGAVAGDARQNFINQRSKSYREGAENQATISLGDPLDAKEKEITLEKELAELKEKNEGASEADLKFVRQKYDYQLRGLKAERELRDTKRKELQDEAGFKSTGTSRFQMSLRTATMRRRNAENAMGHVGLGSQAFHEQNQNALDASNDQRSALQSRYLNPNGTRRRARDIHRDFRRDRKEEKARQKFLRSIDRGGFDPETGKRHATGQAIHDQAQEDQYMGDQWGEGGLETGHLKTGHLETGHLRAGRSSGLDERDWMNQFRRNDDQIPESTISGGAGISEMHETLKSMHAMHDARLPSQTIGV
jgi:hypothetical protein